MKLSLDVSNFLFLGSERGLSFTTSLVSVRVGVVRLRSTLRGGSNLLGLAIIGVLVFSGVLLNLCLSGFHYDVSCYFEFIIF